MYTFLFIHEDSIKSYFTVFNEIHHTLVFPLVSAFKSTTAWQWRKGTFSSPLQELLLWGVWWGSKLLMREVRTSAEGQNTQEPLVPLQVIVFLSTVLRSYQCSVRSGDLPGSRQWTKLTTNELEKALSATFTLATGRAAPCTWPMNGGERVWSRDAQQIPGGVFDWSKLSQQKTRVLASAARRGAVSWWPGGNGELVSAAALKVLWVGCSLAVSWAE